jgi:hypothetical protein
MEKNRDRGKRYYVSLFLALNFFFFAFFKLQHTKETGGNIISKGTDSMLLFKI